MTLQTDLDALAASTDQHVLGVAVHEVETGEILGTLNPNHPFQLASMYKIPVLITAFRLVDAGKLNLRGRYPIQHTDKINGSGILAHLDAGLTPTLHDLLTLMIIVSDNTATDKVLEIIGGLATVNAMLQELGLSNIVLHHTTRDLLHAVFPTHDLVLTTQEMIAYRKQHKLPRHDERVASAAETNTATPLALNELILKLAREETASPEATRQMLNILKRQQYNHRLPYHFPDQAVFAHKTGTLSDMQGDTGILLHHGKRFVITGIVQTPHVPLPLSPAQHAIGDELLAQLGEKIYKWVTQS